MLREAFVFDETDLSIKKVEITDNRGVSWMQAKKLLRAYYLEKATALRQITQKDYFKHA